MSLPLRWCATVSALLASQQAPGGQSEASEKARRRLADAETRLRRFQDAIAAGVDPAAVSDAINQAQADRAAARAELDSTAAPDTISDGEIYAMIDSLGDVGAALSSAKPDRLASLYDALGLHVGYGPADHVAHVKIHPANDRVNSARVGGAICALSTRIPLPEPA
ncbi:hypothetical protein [Saccharopolyspora rosea]|uniref:hypothetical protein n=1 Tax=Saccharopolyspora rosea TaxID=524884 RepID=UPI0021DA3760|nr:hypothetical protein [Saccharopolyspora rosea]